MNINKLIVELLKAGKNVEIKGIGTFYAQDVAAHHDAEKGVFYPDRMSVAFTGDTSGDEYVIDAMAKRECVSRDIAERMWQSYVSALEDKLVAKGSHSFEGMGTLVRCADGYAFTADPGLDLSDSNVRPIDNVRKYDTSNAADPFAAFEQSMTQVDAAEEIPVKPDPGIPEGYVPAPHTEPEPVVEPDSAEPEPVVEVDSAEPEQGADNDNNVDAELTLGPDSVEPEPVVANDSAEPESNDENDNYVEPEEEKENTIEPEPVAADDDNDGVIVVRPRRKKNHTWLWILLLLLLLLLAGGAYFYFVYRPNHGGTVQSAINDLKSMVMGSKETPAVVEEESTTAVVEKTDNGRFILEDYAMIYTFSPNLIEYNDGDIDRDTRAVCRYLRDYVSNFLASRNYTNAKNPMMDRMATYAKQRFGELYSPDVFYADRLIDQSGDYIHDYIYDELKARREHNTIVKVRTELMDQILLGRMLDELIVQLGLQPDKARIVAPAPAAKPKVKTNVDEPQAQVVKASKQGYDIVAGFFTNKASANRLANVLKRQGCDAYIIDKQGLYFVSMGSAPTQTAAEALFKHISSWYDGDIVIRKL